jgi:hypothetical protein
MNEALQLAIRRIVEKVPQDCYFDSHFVIGELIKQRSNVFHRYCAHFNTTKRAHSELAKKIGKCRIPVEKRGDSYSANIRGDVCSCKLWLRL